MNKKVYIVLEESLFPNSRYREEPVAFSNKDYADVYIANRKEDFKEDLDGYQEDFEEPFEYNEGEIENRIDANSGSFYFYCKFEIVTFEIDSNAQEICVVVEEDNNPKECVAHIISCDQSKENAKNTISCCLVDTIHNIEKGLWTENETGISKENLVYDSDEDVIENFYDGVIDCNTGYYIAWNYYTIKIDKETKFNVSFEITFSPGVSRETKDKVREYLRYIEEELDRQSNDNEWDTSISFIKIEEK